MKRVSQAEKLRRLLADGQPHSTPAIQVAVYGANHLGSARIASRVTDLRSDGYEIASWKDKNNPTIWWYQMKLEGKAAPKKVFVPQFVLVNGVRKVRMVEQ